LYLYTVLCARKSLKIQECRVCWSAGSKS